MVCADSLQLTQPYSYYHTTAWTAALLSTGSEGPDSRAVRLSMAAYAGIAVAVVSVIALPLGLLW